MAIKFAADSPTLSSRPPRRTGPPSSQRSPQATAGVEGAIVNAIKKAPKAGGPRGLVLPLVETEVETHVSSLVAKEGNGEKEP